MELGDGNSDIVHPEVRAHINSLVSALGGAAADDDDGYKLGDDALEVLRDIKKWIRFYDQKTNRMDVARCLAEANIVSGDLLPILATWPENASDNRFKTRIALACYEVLAPLTWPIERDLETMTFNHHRHLPVLQLAQLKYKRDVINFDGAQVLHAAVRVALPSMAVPSGERTIRDSGIIKLALYFLRNIAMIAIPPGLTYDEDEAQISRSATIDAFSFQDIFLTILTIASNMGEDFRTEDVIVMEIIFHLVKRVDISKLFLSEQQLNKAKDDDLRATMAKEAAMLKSYTKKPTRHNRFGTMIWVQRENGKMSAVSGQEVLHDRRALEAKMDNTKTFKPPRRARREDMEPKDLGPRVSLNSRANDQLRGFVEDFLDSGFNPLFQHLRKSIDREAPHVLHYHRAQFFYLIGWFLEAERARHQSKGGRRKPSQDEVSSFNLVAGVMNQEMFITLNRTIDRAYNDKDWAELTAVMRCFTQILLTVQDMSASGNEDDEEIAENILSRLFYEETTHDAVANIVRTYKDQGFEYLDACTDLAHVYIRILEGYSKQHVDLQVRTRRRTRRKKTAAAKAADPEGEAGPADAEDDSANDEAHAQRTTNERKFDFKRFANRFIPQGVVDTFVKFTRFYRDLDDAQLKRAHRYFYRVAFKQDMSVMLFRVDIIHLLYNMIKGPEALDKASSMHKEWEELVKQIIKKCVRKIDERPALIIELLFSKINSTAHYLEYGFEKQTVTLHPKPGAELVFRHILELDRQIAVAVGALLDKNQQDHINWVKKQLTLAEGERRAWESAALAMEPAETAEPEAGSGSPIKTIPAKDPPEITLRPDDDARRTAIFKNSHLRLLMKLVGFERLAPSLEETPESIWTIPSNLTAGQLKESLDFINQAEFDPPVFDNDESAEDQLRRKSAVRKKADFDDDEDGLDGDDDNLFAPGGPTARKSADGLMDDKPKRRRRRRREGDEEATGPTEEELDERARARREKELEKARRVKSELYVHASDDETDDERDREFFEREEEIRQRLIKSVIGDFGAAAKPNSKKRKSKALLDNDNDDDDDILVEPSQDSPPASLSKKRKSEASVVSSDDDEPQVDKPMPVPAPMPTPTKSRKRRAIFVDSSDEDEEGGSGSSQNLAAAQQGGSDSDDAMAVDTPLSSSPRVAAEKDGALPSKPVTTEVLDVDKDMDEDGDNVALPTTSNAARVHRPARRRKVFLGDSSDEE